MSLDISKLLEGWQFDAQGPSVRIIHGEDGREKIQVRLELGLLQMEIDGRPDGERVEEFASWLEYYQAKQAAHDAANPDGAPFRLESSDCSRLLREGVLYYQRYVSFWRLERYELCARDTNRNLKLFAFVREYARRQNDKLQFDQWRPYVTMMHARAVATPLVEMRDFKTAIGVVDAGIAAINQFLADYNQTENAKNCGELMQLVTWREQLVIQESGGTPPPIDENAGGDEAASEQPSLLARLEIELDDAIREERFEDAARLRDEIRRVSGGSISPGGKDQL